jgi:hypothetical protein
MDAVQARSNELPLGNRKVDGVGACDIREIW